MEVPQIKQQKAGSPLPALCFEYYAGVSVPDTSTIS